jgi:3D (Asp-Asp-Asp) domain-containing protein
MAPPRSSLAIRRWLLCALAAVVVLLAVLVWSGSSARHPMVLAGGAQTIHTAGQVALGAGNAVGAGRTHARARGASSAAGAGARRPRPNSPASAPRSRSSARAHPARSLVSARAKPCASRCNASPPEPPHPISHKEWLSGVLVTEYYPVPEGWFAGRPVHAPGLVGRYPVDWLYSAHGMAMDGEGITTSGLFVHIEHRSPTQWINAAGRRTRPVHLGQWTDGLPAWLRGGWRNHSGEVTYPLAGGGWSNGRGGRRRHYRGVTFAPGPSLSLRYYHSIAVDPKLIPEGSRVYVPAYRSINGGWFLAQDTGSAIKGRHIDVFRPPPASPAELARRMTDQRIYVVPPRS